VDDAIANHWGKIIARSHERGRPMAIMDAFLAATAEVRQLTLVTRNVSDFPMVEVLSPWS
jgi:hypothetical protein